MLLASETPRTLGADDSARLGFGDVRPLSAPRQLLLDGRAAFELSFWCGTCPFLFQRLGGATETLSLDPLAERLAAGLDGIDPEVVERYGALLPRAAYLPLLLTIEPRLQRPASGGDYFAEDQVRVWGIDPFWGLPEHPRTPYYRTGDAPLGPDARGIEGHLYEFVVPMVPPTMNDPARVDELARRLEISDRPTAVALTTLDVCLPAMDHAAEYVEHWCLTHFLLDGHHKLQAAARDGRPLRLLSLLTVDASLATESQVLRVPELRRAMMSS